MNFCACIGPVGKDALCPCAMSRIGLTSTPLYSEETKEELREVLANIFKEK